MTTKPGNVLALEINTTVSTNLIKNHSGAFGFWGWSYFNNVGVNPSSTAFVVVANVGADFRNDAIAVVAGQWVGLTLNSKVIGAATRAYIVRAMFYDASDTLLSNLTLVNTNATSAGATNSATPQQAPAGATKFRLRVNPLPAPGDIELSKFMLTTAATSGAANQPFPADVWVNILGSGLTITTESGNTLDGVQDILTPGFLSATITDPALDPATTSSLKKGRPIRLQATASGTKPVWQGVIDTADTEYEDNKDGPVSRRITISATDVARALDNAPLATTVLTGGFTGQVAAAAYAARLPTSDGSTTPTPGTGVEATDTSATSTDWIRRACNTHGGYVWIDQLGAIQQRLIAALATSPAYTFSDNFTDTGAIFYTKIGLNFGSRSLVNALNIKRFNVDEIEDDSKTYGPYVAQVSEFDNGRITKDIEITSGSPSAVAAVILPVFATPKRFPREIKVNALDDLAKVLSVNKYDPVRVKRLALFDDVVRVLSIRHEITSTTWFTYFALRPLEAATAVTVTNPPAGSDTGPGDIDTGSGTGFPRLAERSRTTNFAMPSGSFGAIPFDTAQTADGITWDATNNRFQITRAGRYHIDSVCLGNPVGVGGVLYGLEITVNGVRRQINHCLATANLTTLVLSKTLKLAPGDLIQIRVYCSTGGATLLGDAAQSSTVSVAYIGP